jgi:CDP-diacylglycerol--serine O-phosphatidyltransferase
MAILAVMLVYAFASIDPPKVLFGGFLIYAISGIVYTLLGIRKRRKARMRRE